MDCQSLDWSSQRLPDSKPDSEPRKLDQKTNLEDLDGWNEPPDDALDTCSIPIMIVGIPAVGMGMGESCHTRRRPVVIPNSVSLA